MKKKEFLTESKKKAIIAEKEKAIVESFAKQFNKIKRLDENEVQEATYYYVATKYLGDEPGEVTYRVLTQQEYDVEGYEFEQNGWDVEGPMNGTEMSQYTNKLDGANKDWRYYNSDHVDEPRSNLFIDKHDKFERDSLDSNW